MRILTLDIETAPNLAYVWGMWQQNVGLNQLSCPGYVMCMAAKWLGEADVLFLGGPTASDRATMLQQAHDLLSEADVVVTYNGNSFDLKHLNREFIQAGLQPPAPYISVDLLKEVRRHFRFASNKLDFVAGQLGLGHKVKHEGFELWLACLAGDPAAWKRMRTYNVQDVRLTEQLFERLRAWVKLPHLALFSDALDTDSCVACAGTNLHPRGFSYTRSGRYQRYRCADCGKWNRGTRRVEGAPVQSA